MFAFKVGDICTINSPTQRMDGRQFEILEFIYGDGNDYFPPIGLKVRYLDTNRKGTYMNSFDSLEVVDTNVS
jgi:hypothetical protein